MRYLLAALLILATACEPDATTPQDGSGDHPTPDATHALCEVVEAEGGRSASLWNGTGWTVCEDGIDGWCIDGERCRESGRECLDNACGLAEFAQLPEGCTAGEVEGEWWLWWEGSFGGACEWDSERGWVSGEGSGFDQWWQCGRAACEAGQDSSSP